ncbi:hypothetical protein [Brevibacillus brevis]|uniref:hypothetical protein n=1 Tax=Brevibacillus brevis TaxID=1393 RepID=UPI0037C66D80
MRELLKMLKLKLANLLIREKMLRNSDTSHPINARNLEQIRSQIKSLQIKIDMIDVLQSVEHEFKRKRSILDATEQDGSSQ